MQTSYFSTLILALALAGLAGNTPRLPAQTALPLLSVTNMPWRYYQAGNEPANPAQPNTRWHTNTFDDSSWVTGLGLFGFEDNIASYAPYLLNTRLDLTAPGATNQTIAYYFRTHFTFPTNPFGVLLVATNYLDDGAALYLNGKEITRIRIGSGALDCSTTATNVLSEGRPDVVTFPATNLVEGDNVLAVEVHQASHSEDVIFGMSLTALVPIPIVITNQPQSQTVVAYEDRTASFSVGVTGSSPQYQWYSNEVKLAGATNTGYTVTNPMPAMDGTIYSVVVSNGLGAVRSSNAVLRVLADTFAPTVLSAIVSAAPTNRFLVSFSEALLGVNTNSSNWVISAKNPLNYEVALVGATTPLAVTNVLWNGTYVILALASDLYPANQYVLTVRNVADGRFNVQPFAQIGIQFNILTNLVPMDLEWRWTDMFESNLPPAWTTLEYVEDDTYWGSGTAPLGCLWTAASNCVPLATLIEIGWPAYYFRAKFVLPDNFPANATLSLTHLVDDSAVFYLNGREFYRYNLPQNAPVNFDTPALSDIVASCLTTNILVSNLVHDTNIVAVQVNQAVPDRSGPDIFFAAKIDGTFLKGPVIPRIHFIQLPSNQLKLTWPDAGFTLERNPDLANPNGWTAVATGTNYVTTTTGVNFFRLRK